MTGHANPRESASDTALNRRSVVRAAGLGLASTAIGSLAPAAAAGPISQAPARTRVFIREVKRARLFDLSTTWDENPPSPASIRPSPWRSRTRTRAPLRTSTATCLSRPR